MSIYKGSGVAIVTPMKANEEVNYDKLEELIEEQISEGTDCIVIAGTTGESSTLSMEEHHKVICAAVEFAKHRVPVVAGTGSELNGDSNPVDPRSRRSRSRRSTYRNSIL